MTLLINNHVLHFFDIPTMKLSQIILPIIAITATAVVVWCNQPTPSSTDISQRVQQPVTSLFNPVYASDNYVEYTPAALAQAQEDGKNAVVFFHSKSCGSCAKADADFKTNESNLPEDLVVLKADRDTNQALAWELNVPKYHTFAYYNDDWTTDNINWIFTVAEVIQSAESEELIIENAWEYKVFSQEALTMAMNEWKDVALFFHSKSCWSCAKLDSWIQADSSQLPENLIVFKTDWDENQQLAQQYDVAKYHTVAFINQDGSSDNVSGVFTLPELLDAR